MGHFTIVDFVVEWFGITQVIAIDFRFHDYGLAIKLCTIVHI